MADRLTRNSLMGRMAAPGSLALLDSAAPAGLIRPMQHGVPDEYGGVTFSSLVAGEDHTCGLTAGIRLGPDISGQLGDGSQTLGRGTPTAVAVGLVFRSLSAGSNHTCGITMGGTVYCWGLNDDGQLGDGTTITRLQPIRVAGQP